MEDTKLIKESWGVYHPDVIDIYLLLPILMVGLTVSTLFWKSIYILFKYYNRCPQDVVLHLCSLVHALFTVSAIAVFGKIHRNVFSTSVINNWTQNALVVFYMGFYVHDLIYWEYENHRDIVFSSHHIGCVIFLSYPILMGTHASLCFIYIWILQSPNVFMHLRYLMKKYNVSQIGMRLYNINRISFMASFVILRLFIGAHITYLVLNDNVITNDAIKISAIVITVLNFSLLDAVYMHVKKVPIKPIEETTLMAHLFRRKFT